MFDKACVHTFSQGGQNLVIDGNSGAVHVVDAQAMASIQEICAREDIQNFEDLKEFLEPTPHLSDVADEILSLVEEGLLFSPDLTEAPPRPETIVKALCLNVAHDCNLRCDYCFASTGDFKGARELMSLDVAKGAVDFLLQNSKHRKQLEIDFFGGEPLMNWDVVRQTVEYAEAEAAKFGKTFRFTITTNGLGLTPAIEEFINEHMYNVVLSIDGRKEVNDRVRRTVSNHGSVYEIIIPKFQRLVRARGEKSYYVRGTFTSHNLDFSQDVAHLHDLGFDQISMEPVVADLQEEYALNKKDLPRVLQEYDRLAELYLERRREGQAFNFFHFNVELQKGPCLYKRISGCGAGYEYLAVAPSGELFPCHQFVGEPEYILGTVWSGLERTDLSDAFKDSHVLNKPICRSCWAKYFCSGGCEKHNMQYSGSRDVPEEMACEMEKKRLECSFYIQAALSDFPT
ncbi:MAG TPA: thioether cross-link-forming SCIFF peptide maturase [Limnochordia bacterium]|nr:thioether cross-link-forming SCIFF peptide maturase [Limnochordia bacterium]